VRNTLRQEPQSGHVFAFCNQSRTRLKLLLHDGPGLWLCSKRLDAGAFTPVLETVTIDLPEADKFAPDGTALVKIREEVTDEVDYRPGQLFRRRIIRPVDASPRHAGAPQVAALKAR